MVLTTISPEACAAWPLHLSCFGRALHPPLLRALLPFCFVRLLEEMICKIADKGACEAAEDRTRHDGTTRHAKELVSFVTSLPYHALGEGVCGRSVASPQSP